MQVSAKCLSVFDDVLNRSVGFGVDRTGEEFRSAIYIDDAVFSGFHVIGDLVNWIEKTAPEKVNLHIVVLAYHTGGQHFANGKIRDAVKASGKSISIQWWRIRELEDRKAYINNSDVLRPTRIPDDASTQEYVDELTAQKFPPVLRKPGNIGPAGFFSSEEGRDVLEQHFLIKGAHIRDICRNLGAYQRPLGNSVLKTLGFGAVVVTFRNCPNNCPLALCPVIHGFLYSRAKRTKT